MFDAQCDLAALVYDDGEDPDAVLHDFATRLAAQGHRAVGLVQYGRHRHDVPEIAVRLVHNGVEVPLLQQLGRHATGCRLDIGQLLAAGAQIAGALNDGADVLIINRFGKLEREGKGLIYLIEQALGAEIPVVIAVHRQGFPAWIKFADGMSVRLDCNAQALEAWWRGLARRGAAYSRARPATVCEVLK